MRPTEAGKPYVAVPDTEANVTLNVSFRNRLCPGWASRRRCHSFTRRLMRAMTSEDAVEGA